MSNETKKDAAPLIKDATPNQPKDQATQIAEAVAAAIKEALPLAVMAATQIANPKRPVEDPAGNDQCGDCGQKSKACKGEHMQMVVYPRDEEVAQWFTGIKVNGITYRSNGPSHQITVPKENSLASVLSTFENMEKDIARGKQRHRVAGTMGPYGGQVNPLTFGN